MVYESKGGVVFESVPVWIVLTIFPFFFYYGYVEDSYVFLYSCIVFFLFISAVLIGGFIRVVALYVLFYLSIGLLNISSWRGYITVEVLHLYAWAIYLFFAPILVFARVRRELEPIRSEGQQFTKIIIAAHIAVSLVAVAYIYVSIGNVLLNQSLRFRIPTGLEYTVKSVLPIAAIIPFLEIKRKFILLLAVLAPAVLIGSRGTAVVATLAYVLSSIYFMGGRFSVRDFVLENRKYLYYMIFAVGIVVVLFYLRRSGQTELASVDVVIAHYFDYDNFFVRSILPFYLGFKETTGLTTRIVMDGVVNELNPNPLFFADLFTVLPGGNVAAGQTLARIFGASEAGGLTPGLLGGVYIDYGVGGLVFFLVFGFCFVFIDRFMQSSPYFIVVYAQVITQFIHLFHRGFLKPEYVTAIIIAGFYFVLCYRIRLDRGWR